MFFQIRVKKRQLIQGHGTALMSIKANRVSLGKHGLLVLRDTGSDQRKGLFLGHKAAKYEYA